MNQSNAIIGSHSNQQEGFSFSYHCGQYNTVSSFNESNCDEVIRNFFLFMLGSGFSMKNVADHMIGIGEEYMEAELRPYRLDPRIADKWKVTSEVAGDA